MEQIKEHREGKLKAAYKLWVEYLKRSDKYKALCKSHNYFIDYARYTKSFPPPEEYRTNLDISLGLSNTFRYFGDVFTYPLEFILKNMFSQIESEPGMDILGNPAISPEVDNNGRFHIKRANDITYLEDELDNFFGIAEMIADQAAAEKDREPTIEDFKYQLKNILEFDGRILLAVRVRRADSRKGFNKNELKAELDEIINHHVKSERFKNYKNASEYFPYPTKLQDLDSVQRHLEVYDFKKQGRSDVYIQEWIGDTGPEGRALNISREIKYFKKILENVEEGVFPGDYS